MHVACQYGHVEVANALIASGVNVNKKNEVRIIIIKLILRSLIFFGGQENFTALYVASGNGHTDVVKLLLLSGANVHEKNGVSQQCVVLVSR